MNLTPSPYYLQDIEEEKKQKHDLCSQNVEDKVTMSRDLKLKIPTRAREISKLQSKASWAAKIIGSSGHNGVLESLGPVYRDDVASTQL